MRLFFLCLICLAFKVNAQISTLSPMPEPVSNNAVSGATVGGVPHVFSFSGIDATKVWSGIHKKAFRYNVLTDQWDIIAPLPSGTGRIAAGASTVKNKIYIIGGYEVFANGGERSLNEVHIYDPETDTYLPDGRPIPVPIDDQVQAVYKDSLIFVVTGWSQNTNVRNVQIYDPAKDEWLSGTPVPNNSTYKAFGASGTILGDTLYYFGGARFGNNFPPSNFIRKGHINPDDPTDITWSAELNLNSVIYRPACINGDEQNIICLGGSNVTYNYNGIAYNGSGGVAPSGSSLIYSGGKLESDNWSGTFPKIMDFRGAAGIRGLSTKLITAGGMNENQQVTDTVYEYEYFTVSTKEPSEKELRIFPNPAFDEFRVIFEGKFSMTVFNLFGQKLINNQYVNIGTVSLKDLPEGTFFVKIENESGFEKTQKLIKLNSF